MSSETAKRCSIAVCLMLAVLLPGCGGSKSEPVVVAPGAPFTEPAPLGDVTVRLTPAWSGLSDPLLLTGAADGSNRVFIVEQGGRILVTRPRQSDTTTFLDISDDISTGGERGLLGLAFPPDYAKNGTVYIDYTDTRGDTVIARYHVSSADPDRLDADSGEVLLQIEQPFANHNGGGIVFGPDGMLWMWIGDVGQNIWEEIDFVPAADLSNGANFGWNLMEGTHPYPPDADLGDTSGLTGPVVEYDHDAGKSVTGGIVYRGSKHPELDGVYLSADFYGSLWGLRLNADETENAALWTGDALISSFGLDEAGEVYVCDLNGTVLQVEFDLQ
jgi:hypothetical protein